MTELNTLERHAQTALVLVVVALLSWVGLNTHQTSVMIRGLQVEIGHLQAEVNKREAKFDLIERRLDYIEKALNVYMSPDGENTR